MPYFRVFMEGKGIVLPSDDGENAVGFFATRVVRASGVEDAIDKATAMIIQDWTTGPYAAANKGSTPVLSVEKVWPDTMLRALLFKNSGHVFYPDGEGEDEA